MLQLEAKPFEQIWPKRTGIDMATPVFSWATCSFKTPESIFHGNKLLHFMLWSTCGLVEKEQTISSDHYNQHKDFDKAAFVPFHASVFTIGLKRDGQCVATHAHCAKVNQKHPGFLCCHLGLLLLFGARVCTVPSGQWSHNIEFPPIYPPAYLEAGPRAFIALYN